MYREIYYSIKTRLKNHSQTKNMMAYLYGYTFKNMKRLFKSIKEMEKHPENFK